MNETDRMCTTIFAVAALMNTNIDAVYGGLCGVFITYGFIHS